MRHCILNLNTSGGIMTDQLKPPAIIWAGACVRANSQDGAWIEHDWRPYKDRHMACRYVRASYALALITPLIGLYIALIVMVLA